MAARVLPATDEPVRTRVGARGTTFAFQEFMIVEGARGPIESVSFEGAEHARPTEQVLGALREADAVVIGPSNPIASIAPILAVPAMRDAVRAAPGPVVAVSPFVGGQVLKGPTLAFCEHAGIEPTAAGLLDAYEGAAGRHRGRRTGGRDPDAADRHAHGHARGAGAAGGRDRGLRPFVVILKRSCAPPRSSRSRASAPPSSAWAS